MHLTPHELWRDYCHVAPDILARCGLPAAIGYVVGEELMTFAQTAETDEGIRSEAAFDPDDVSCYCPVLNFCQRRVIARACSGVLSVWTNNLSRSARIG